MRQHEACCPKPWLIFQDGRFETLGEQWHFQTLQMTDFSALMSHDNSIPDHDVGLPGYLLPTYYSSNVFSPLGSVLASSLLYFALAFFSGFALGCIRVPFIQPFVGDRVSKLLEMPIMMLAITKSAKLIVRRLHPQPPKSQLFLIGMVAVTLMLAAEAAGSVYIAGKDWKGFMYWITDRDTVAGPVYFAMLAVFAGMPAWS